jgi:predicted amidohydrolase
MISTKIAAIAQLCSTSNKLQNLYNIAQCAGWAKRHGASMLFLPECFGFIGSSAKETLANAELIPFDENEIGSLGTSVGTVGNKNEEGIRNNIVDCMNEINKEWYSSLEEVIDRCFNDDTDADEFHDADYQNIVLPPAFTNNNNNDNVSIVQGLRVIARKSGLYISGGGIHELGAPPVAAINMIDNNGHSNNNNDEMQSKPVTNNNRVYNTHLILNNKGQIVTRYRKIHLFDVSIPSQGVNLCESATTAPGSKLVVCDSPLGKLGLSTCYDLRFPEMYQELTSVGGADIVLVPSAFTVPTGKAHWHTLLKARAIENQCYVLASAQFGKHNEKRKSYGHSIAIDAWGEVLSDAGGYDSEEQSSLKSPKIILCEINDEKIKSIRERMPIRNHRQSCTFSW